MSELKVHRFITTDELFHDANAGALYYDKSEADKVIAELEEKLKNSRNARKYWRKEYLIEYKECLHNKHKRCLAMAEKCDYKATIYRMMINVESSKIDSCPYFIKLYSKKKDRFEKWRKRWLAIVEKFKPNSTAQ